MLDSKLITALATLLTVALPLLSLAAPLASGASDTAEVLTSESDTAEVLTSASDTAKTLTETIIVTASRESGSLDEAIIPLVYFDESDIANRQSIFLEALLRGAPGINISSTGGRGGNTAIRLRGGESNHTKLLIDGVDAGDFALATPVNLAFVTLTGVRRVLLLRGPQSGIWGSDALSGVILLESTPRPEGVSANFKLAGGNRDNLHVEGGGSRAGERGWIQGNLSHFSTSGINHLLVGDEKDAYRIRTAHATAGLWNEAGGESGVVMRHVDLAYDYDGFSMDTDTNYSTGEQTQLSFYSNGPIAGSWQYLVRFTGFESTHRFYQENALANAYQGERLKLTTQSTYEASQHRLTGALELLQETYDQSVADQRFGDPNYRRRDEIFSLATEYEWRHEPVRVMVSLRYDDNSNWQPSLTYRLAMRWRSKTSGTAVFASLATGVVNPTFIERYGYTPGNFLGNAALKPESSKEISLEVRQTVGGDSEIWLGAFVASFNDEITTTFDASSSLSTVANQVGKSLRRGLEFGLKSRLNETLALSGALSLLDAKEPAAQGTLNPVREIRRPALSGKLLLDWQSGRWGGQLGWIYVGSQQDTDFSSFPSTRVRLDEYSLIHFNLEVELTKNVALFAKLDNAFNENYQEVLGYRSIGQQWLFGVNISL